MSKTTYWAWIPTFTYGVNFDQRIKEIEKNEEKKWIKLDENEKDYILQTIIKPIINKLNYNFKEISDCESYSKEHIEDDKIDDPKKFLHIIFVDNRNKVSYVLFSKYKEKVTDISKEEVRFGKIEYDFNKNNIATGLIKTEIIYPCYTPSEKSDMEASYKEIYVCVRDVYHDHSFHQKGHDLLLPPVEASDKTDAVEAILNIYEDKVLGYHRILKSFLDDKKPKSVKKVIKFIFLAKGEMIYAQRFIELVDEERFIPFKTVFIHAYNSFEDFNKNIIAMYEFEGSEKIEEVAEKTKYLTKRITHLTNILVTFTILVVFLTGIMTLDAVFGILNEIFNEYNLTLIFIFIFMVVFIILISLLLIKYEEELIKFAKNIKER